ncbi:MAG: V-type ATP synthase subunit E [Clostridia bacterium]|nr:V-type ATP synthase subunit E [Clostridia bacterium]
MSLNGLEKITDKILAEAEAKAEKILADAQAECDRITAEYANRADALKETLSAEAEREGMEHVSRAKAIAATSRRNLLLASRSALIDEVFAGALDGTKKLANENYTDLLVGLLSAAMLEQLDAEQKSRLYDEEDAEEPEKYEVLFNQRDRDRVGRSVVEGAQKKLSGKADANKLARLTLSEQTVAIDGGLVLRCGSVESNCSLALLFAQLRQELEGDVSRALFDARGQH